MLLAKDFITRYYGEKCSDYDEDCECCQVWKDFEELEKANLQEENNNINMAALIECGFSLCEDYAYQWYELPIGENILHISTENGGWTVILLSQNRSKVMRLGLIDNKKRLKTLIKTLKHMVK